MQGLVTTGTTKPLTHRPSRLDSQHTACGLRLDDTVHLHIGEGQTCECCAHVVAQVAAAVRGEPSWAETSRREPGCPQCHGSGRVRTWTESGGGYRCPSDMPCGQAGFHGN